MTEATLTQPEAELLDGTATDQYHDGAIDEASIDDPVYAWSVFGDLGLDYVQGLNRAKDLARRGLLSVVEERDPDDTCLAITMAGWVALASHRHERCEGPRAIIETHRTQTADDAILLINLARIGSLASNPTPEYLEALRQKLYDWVGLVEDKLGDTLIAQERDRKARKI